MPKRTTKTKPAKKADDYRHDSEAILRPEAGAQTTFSPNKQKKPVDYRHNPSLSPDLEQDKNSQGDDSSLSPTSERDKKSTSYDSSLSPALEWDENSARQEGEALIAKILQADSIEVAKEAAEKLKKLERPFLNWAGKAEAQNITVPSLPLFVHERLSTKAILDTLEKRKRGRATTLSLFGESDKSIGEKMGGAYEHSNGWQNRLILGDSLQVMNSLLQYETMGGKVQMVYMDPPYGIRFGGNFQPFVRNLNVRDGEDGSFSREPEMVQAYRDTWQLGVHSWLTYMRDRLFLAREMLTDSGSCFVQISDENVHLVRSVMDEVFGRENFVNLITYRTTSGLGSKMLSTAGDYLIWYAKNKDMVKYRQLFVPKAFGGNTMFKSIVKANGEDRLMNERELQGFIEDGDKPYRYSVLVSSGLTPSCVYEFEFEGKAFMPGGSKSWRTNLAGMEKLRDKKRLQAPGNALCYISYWHDFPVGSLTNFWQDTTNELSKSYVVQTSEKIIQRCMLMTTDPGDLVFDPTCGSGTTAVVAEQWGRRWITTDVSRVPLVLTRQRLLTATYPYYELQDEKTGPAAGFTFARKQNKRGEEVGGIVPHVTLKSIANDEPPAEEILVDRPEKRSGTVRVTGPFCVEAVIPTPLTSFDEHDGVTIHDDKHYLRMLKILQLSPKVHSLKNQSQTIENVRPPADPLSLHAEADLSTDGDGVKGETVAIVFGPANGAISESVVLEAAREAKEKKYDWLFVIAFAIEPPARKTVADCKKIVGIPAVYVQASTDLAMSDLLKNMRTSKVFSVCGMPDIELKSCGKQNKDGEELYQATLSALDIFDPVTRKTESRPGDDVPCWMLDTDYDNSCFRAGQVFFPKTSAWDKLKRALGGEWDDSVWEHLAGTTSEPFVFGENRQIAVKVIDERGNELMVVKRITEAN